MDTAGSKFLQIWVLRYTNERFCIIRNCNFMQNVFQDLGFRHNLSVNKRVQL